MIYEGKDRVILYLSAPIWSLVMKRFTIILLLILLSTACWGQNYPITVTTDKKAYQYGDDIKIFVTVYNPTNSSIVLKFASTCQSSYYIDNFHPKLICAMMLTERNLLPGSSYTWPPHIHKFSEYALNPGRHSVVGEVIGYGVSNPIYITVEPITLTVKSIPVSGIGMSFSFGNIIPIFIQTEYSHTFTGSINIMLSAPHTHTSDGNTYEFERWIVNGQNRIQGQLGLNFIITSNTTCVAEYYIKTGVNDTATPFAYSLSQNYPNPFNPWTSIGYTLAESGQVLLDIMNVSGQVVRTLEDGYQGKGLYTLFWDGRDGSGIKVSAGVYLYRIKTGNFLQTRKMVLMQ